MNQRMVMIGVLLLVGLMLSGCVWYEGYGYGHSYSDYPYSRGYSYDHHDYDNRQPSYPRRDGWGGYHSGLNDNDRGPRRGYSY